MRKTPTLFFPHFLLLTRVFSLLLLLWTDPATAFAKMLNNHVFQCEGARVVEMAEAQATTVRVSVAKSVICPSSLLCVCLRLAFADGQHAWHPCHRPHRLRACVPVPQLP